MTALEKVLASSAKASATAAAAAEDGVRVEDSVSPPRPPPMSTSPPRVLIIGAGSRGLAYARAIGSSCNGIITSVVEPDDYKRRYLGQTMIWGDDAPQEGSYFRDWPDFIVFEKR